MSKTDELLEAILHVTALFRAANQFGEDSLPERMICVSSMMAYMDDVDRLVAEALPVQSRNLDVQSIVLEAKRSVQ